MERTRHLYLDLLRVLATAGVIVLHASAQNWDLIGARSLTWQVLNVYDSLVRWTIPVFVMISGVLFLDPEREIDTKSLYSKNILRLVTAFLFWTLIYALYGAWQEGFVLSTFVTELIRGNYHMWYIFMIAGLYMIVPLVRCITASPRATRYFLALSFFFTVVVHTIFDLAVPLLPESAIKTVLNAAIADYSAMYLRFVLGYVFYLVLGHALHNHVFTARERRWIYLGAVLGFAATIFINGGVAWLKNEPYGDFYGYFSLNVFLESLGVFVLFKHLPLNLGAAGERVLVRLSKYSFGIYLVHALLLEILKKQLGLDSLAFNAVFAIPVILVLVYGVSLVISAVLNHIPILKRYIV